MKVLAFDCSTARGSVAVVDHGEVIFSETFECPRGRGGAFFEVLERALRRMGKPERIAVGIGPGSYNGLRTALAAAEGLRLATDAELVGVVSVRTLACNSDEYTAVNDARGGVFYFVRIRDREIAGELELLSASALAARLETEPARPILASAPIATLPRIEVAFPDAELLARLARQEKPVIGTIEPLYLKAAHITQPKRPRLLPRAK